MTGNQNQFLEYVLELLAPLGQPVGRRMFGGYGIFNDGLMFAIIADRQLYFKTDARNVMEYIDRGLPPFTYRRSGKNVSLSYYRTPDEILDDSEALLSWAQRALQAATAKR
ncbi:MAG TPA: TfoX/Sxy family protein [Gammaproteobacteria bacterium]